MSASFDSSDRNAAARDDAGKWIPRRFRAQKDRAWRQIRSWSLLLALLFLVELALWFVPGLLPAWHLWIEIGCAALGLVAVAMILRTVRKFYRCPRCGSPVATFNGDRPLGAAVCTRCGSRLESGGR
jgi:DNA-directed RNA polymerase subunit RPC12/RpoP